MTRGSCTTGITVALVTVALSVAALATAGPADAVRTTTASHCGSFPDLVTLEHAQAARRETTLTSLVAVIRAHRDPFGLNANQIATLQGAGSAIQALDQKVSTHCYASRTALTADVGTLYTEYRVYWLRVPQTQVIAAADYLGDARTRLGDAAAKLAGIVGTNSRAKSDLDAMNHALTAADAKVGVAPNVAASIAVVPTLQPAADMTADTAAINTARANLGAARAAMSMARGAGLRVVADLGG